MREDILSGGGKASWQHRRKGSCYGTRSQSTQMPRSPTTSIELRGPAGRSSVTRRPSGFTRASTRTMVSALHLFFLLAGAASCKQLVATGAGSSAEGPHCQALWKASVGVWDVSRALPLHSVSNLAISKLSQSLVLARQFQE